MSSPKPHRAFSNQFEQAYRLFCEPETQATGYWMLYALLAPRVIFPYLVNEQGGLGLLTFSEDQLHYLMILCADQIVVRDLNQLRVIKDRSRSTPYVIEVR